MNLTRIIARALTCGADRDRRGYFRDGHGPQGVRLRLCYIPRERKRSAAGLARDYQALTNLTGRIGKHE